MESSSIASVSDLFTLAQRNFVEAYLALAEAVPNHERTEEGGCSAVRSLERNALGNFAICCNLDRTASFEAWRLAQDRQVFQVYVPADGEVDRSLLQARGFDYQQSLQLMVLTESPRPAPMRLSILPIGDDGREQVTEMLADVFFGHLNGEERRRVSTIVSRSSLKMYGAWDPFVVKTYRSMFGATSIYEAPESVGLYNLFVSTSSRGKGVGSSIVLGLAASRFIEGRKVTLQCNPNLDRFYTNLGFSRVGLVHIFHKRRP